MNLTTNLIDPKDKIDQLFSPALLVKSNRDKQYSLAPMLRAMAINHLRHSNSVVAKKFPWRIFGRLSQRLRIIFCTSKVRIEFGELILRPLHLRPSSVSILLSRLLPKVWRKVLSACIALVMIMRRLWSFIIAITHTGMSMARPWVMATVLYNAFAQGLEKYCTAFAVKANARDGLDTKACSPIKQSIFGCSVIACC